MTRLDAHLRWVSAEPNANALQVSLVNVIAASHHASHGLAPFAERQRPNRTASRLWSVGTGYPLEIAIGRVIYVVVPFLRCCSDEEIRNLSVYFWCRGAAQLLAESLRGDNHVRS